MNTGARFGQATVLSCTYYLNLGVLPLSPSLSKLSIRPQYFFTQLSITYRCWTLYSTNTIGPSQFYVSSRILQNLEITSQETWIWCKAGKNWNAIWVRFMCNVLKVASQTRNLDTVQSREELECNLGAIHVQCSKGGSAR